MPNRLKTIAIVNGTGRQAASVIRAVAAVGYAVRAHVHSLKGLVAEELADLPNVRLFEGPLLNNQVLIDTVFEGAQIAFINTNPLGGDEIKIGKALANAAKKRNIQHFIYSSMPDHSIHNPRWPALPQWACKFTVENYIRQLGLPATFVYAGIYNNNFTSLPYPLFCMDFKDDGTLEWRAPFHPDTKLPWLDAEHDVGPAVLQIFKDGPGKWNGHRIALAFEMLTPLQVCQAFEKALDRPCKYVFSKRIEIKVPIPNGYREQLAGIEILFGEYNAPYFPGPDFEYDTRRKGSNDTITGKSSTEASRKTKAGKLTDEARSLWPPYRSIYEYAKEAFVIEEEANGKTWMIDKSVST
ncbi:hypothetical protein AYO20_09166 [Fonsecaea nubica]|uniref:NmrA-like domain-containing protein n=2 Tax=Fonsecaea TaxID=40354 RepID=A0A0D2DP99_9EURO|nr:uncharacterized protein Z517_06183 [Fonsecaea pedrosoi CBS 271.37]XP_022496627.1 hypothetical protein AYO20_09166 [Fonsecaea nubica]KAH0840614.1 Nitrogen metabolite repression protein nmrA [Fonsecaea pedrosoi]KIW79571.1 hypothetical protein Z517_06183 [Fonsecaea pedrosoi CBS 271.37]OAL29526.1 hypothetical protein AYO20_09166 [Fonsecaea nubica]